jgi:hypothetical protein
MSYSHPLSINYAIKTEKNTRVLELGMKCELCEEEAIYRFSPDLDIDGLGGCYKHKKSVEIAYYILLNEGIEAFNSFIVSLKKDKTPGTT